MDVDPTVDRILRKTLEDFANIHSHVVGSMAKAGIDDTVFEFISALNLPYEVQEHYVDLYKEYKQNDTL